MTRAASTLQMISIGLLCIFIDHIMVTETRCVSQKRLQKRLQPVTDSPSWDQAVHGGPNGTVMMAEMEPQSQTCSNFITALQNNHEDRHHNHRSLSPWRYRIHNEENRIPAKIAVAECLCQGCIIDRREDRAYNSVLVYGESRVLKKTRCPTDPDRYRVEEFTVKIPVACTCVVPRLVSSS